MFDLATAKTRLGITGTTQDTDLQLALDASLAFAENYCDRNFMYAAETARFYHTHTYGSVQLHRYPLEQITDISPAVKYKAHLSAGIIDFHSPSSAEQVDISYTGGYRTLPADLEIAMWTIFDDVWPSFSGGGGTVAAGTIQSITLQDVGTVRYATGSAAVAGVSAGAIPDKAAGILDFYRLQQC